MPEVAFIPISVGTKFVTRTIEGGRVRLLPKSGQPLEMTLLRRVGLVTFLVLHQEHPLTLHVTLEIAVELTYPVVMAFNRTLGLEARLLESSAQWTF